MDLNFIIRDMVDKTSKIQVTGLAQSSRTKAGSGLAAQSLGLPFPIQMAPARSARASDLRACPQSARRPDLSLSSWPCGQFCLIQTPN